MRKLLYLFAVLLISGCDSKDVEYYKAHDKERAAMLVFGAGWVDVGPLSHTLLEVTKKLEGLNEITLLHGSRIALTHNAIDYTVATIGNVEECPVKKVEGGFEITFNDSQCTNLVLHGLKAGKQIEQVYLLCTYSSEPDQERNGT